MCLSLTLATELAHPLPRMAKTFDNISEASATNYLFIFSQRTLGLQDEPPTPPPLNALGLPCKAICLLWGQLQKKDETLASGETASEAKMAAFDVAWNIAPLAKKVTEYILNHQDDAAQEDRWRTTMKREMGRSFRKQRDAMRDVQTKMDLTIQLVKDLAKQPKANTAQVAV